MRATRVRHSLAGAAIQRPAAKASAATTSTPKNVFIYSAVRVDLLEPHVDLRGQCAMHRAHLRDLQQARPLFVAQRASKLDRHFDAIDPAVAGFAFFAVSRVNLRMPERYGDVLERDLLLPRIEADGHRGARAKRGEDEIVRRCRSVGAAERDRLINFEAMPS